MKAAIAIAVCFLAASAYAAGPSPPSVKTPAAAVPAQPGVAAPQQQIKPTDTFPVTLSAAQLDVLLGSLHDSRMVSARDANDLDAAIRQQIAAKLAPAGESGKARQ